MTEEINLETYLLVSSNEYRICLFDTKNLKNVYDEYLKIDNKIKTIDYNILIKFLDDNIFKIEKLIGKFVENIFLILETDKINLLSFGIKRKNYDNHINKKFLEKMIIDAKDFYRENYQNNKILHILINKYLINGIQYSSFEDNLIGEEFCIEIQFISLSDNFASDLDKVLQKYQIKIIQYLDGNYIKSFFENDNIQFSRMVYKIINGFNHNEVKLVPKNFKKLGFFEKFFQFLS